MTAFFALITVVPGTSRGCTKPGSRKSPPANAPAMRHVLADACHAGGVFHVALERDATAVRQRLEDVGRGVLVHAHGHLASGLHSGENAAVAIVAAHRRRNQKQRDTPGTVAQGAQLQ